MWLLPTRNRPSACRALIHAMAQVGDVPEVAVMIDHAGHDGLPLYDQVPWPRHWHVHVAHDHLELAAAVNRLVGLHPGRPFYGLIADHARPRTLWSRAAEQVAGDWCIAYTDDGWLRGRRADDRGRRHLTGAVAVGGRLVETLGWLMLPELVHLYVDDALELIGERLDLLRYLPGVLVEADRPETTGRQQDVNHRRLWRGACYRDRDRRAFEAWRDGAAAAAVERVRGAMERVAA